MSELSRRQQRFVDEYAIDLNGAAAARRMGIPEASARSSASRFLRDEAVRAAVAAELARRQAASRIQHEAVLGELARVAFFDPARMVDADGRLLPLAAMDADTRAGLGSVDIVEIEATERAPARRQVRMRPGQKMRALLELAKHTAAREAERAHQAAHERREAYMTEQGFTKNIYGVWERPDPTRYYG